MFRKLPVVRRKIKANLEEARKDFVKSIHGCDLDRDFVKDLPAGGNEQSTIINRIQYYQNMEGHFDYVHVLTMALSTFITSTFPPGSCFWSGLYQHGP
jgi:hypothetical protein